MRVCSENWPPPPRLSSRIQVSPVQNLSPLAVLFMNAAVPVANWEAWLDNNVTSYSSIVGSLLLLYDSLCVVVGLHAAPCPVWILRMCTLT